METITDFQKWLEGVEPEDHNEVYALYKAVQECSSYGIYEVKPARGQEGRWIVTAKHVNQPLLLNSEEARKTFLNLIARKYTDGELDMESWHSYKCALIKDD